MSAAATPFWWGTGGFGGLAGFPAAQDMRIAKYMMHTAKIKEVATVQYPSTVTATRNSRHWSLFFGAAVPYSSRWSGSGAFNAISQDDAGVGGRDRDVER